MRLSRNAPLVALISLALFAAACSKSATNATTPSAASDSTKVNSAVASAIDTFRESTVLSTTVEIPGSSVAVRQAGRPVGSVSSGFTNPQKGEKMPTNAEMEAMLKESLPCKCELVLRRGERLWRLFGLVSTGWRRSCSPTDLEVPGGIDLPPAAVGGTASLRFAVPPTACSI